MHITKRAHASACYGRRPEPLHPSLPRAALCRARSALTHSAGPLPGDRFNAMIAPFGVGPMSLSGAIWYQGESNNGQGRYYSCAFPAMITAWRAAFRSPRLWVGFVQIAGYRYGGASHPDPSADLRQAQLSALALPNTSVATAIDTGDWMSVHPPDKQTPSRRLAAAALDERFGRAEYAKVHRPPLYAGQAVLRRSRAMDGSSMATTVLVRLSHMATTTVPPWATASSTLGLAGSIPRNACLPAQMPRALPALGPHTSGRSHTAPLPPPPPPLSLLSRSSLAPRSLYAIHAQWFGRRVPPPQRFTTHRTAGGPDCMRGTARAVAA